MEKELDNWLTVSEVAEKRQVSLNSVRVAIRTGRLAHVRKGKVYLIRRDIADAWKPGNRGPKKEQE